MNLRKLLQNQNRYIVLISSVSSISYSISYFINTGIALGDNATKQVNLTHISHFKN